MSKVIIGGVYDVSKYITTRPRVKVMSSVVNGGLYIPETTITLRYVKGMFDGQSPTFGSDSLVWIYDDDDDLIFDGTISQIQSGQGQTQVQAVAAVNKILTANIEITAGPEHPAWILNRILSGLGIPTENAGISASYYPEMLAVFVAGLNDNCRGSDTLSRLVEMISADVAVENGALVFVPQPTGFVNLSGVQSGPASLYTLIGSGYPVLVDDGSQRQTKGVSLNYVFGADVPLSLGSTTNYMWSQDYGAGSNLQCYGYESAVAIATARFERFGRARPLYMVPCQRQHVHRPVLGNSYNVSSGGMQGVFRLVGYETDGKHYWLYLEAW